MLSIHHRPQKLKSPIKPISQITHIFDLKHIYSYCSTILLRVQIHSLFERVVIESKQLAAYY